MTYVGSFGYFLARGSMLLNDYSLEKLMLNGGPEYAACLV
jgi:hypothetical protein